MVVIYGMVRSGNKRKELTGVSEFQKNSGNS
jgi:hypothetical protein